MKTFIGSKVINAKPCPRDEFDKIRGFKTTDKDPEEEGYIVFYPDGFKSWYPKEVFETSYREMIDGEKDLALITEDETKLYNSLERTVFPSSIESIGFANDDIYGGPTIIAF